MLQSLKSATTSKKIKLQALKKVRESLQKVDAKDLDDVFENIHSDIFICFMADSDSCRETAIDIVMDIVLNQKCSHLVLLFVFQVCLRTLAHFV